MDFLSLLRKRKVLLFDGSLGTELLRRGLGSGELPDNWNRSHPEIITELFKEYYDSRSDIVQTATFRSNAVALEAYGITDENTLFEINKSAGKILREICPEGKGVIGDIGPSGEFLPPVGKGDLQEIKKGFELQAEALNPFIDAWHLETFSDIKEMNAAIEAVQSHSAKPVIASMTYKKTPKGYFTVMGNSVEECFRSFKEKGVNVVGANCTLGSKDYLGLVKELRSIDSEFPISIKPNAGQPELENGIAIYKQSPQDFALELGEILEDKVQIIGGCCGTQPIHIKLLRKQIDAFLKGRN